MKVLFKTQNHTFAGEFNDCQTAKEIIERLPVESTISLWGDEIYFCLGFKASASGATMDVESGDIAYWSQGKSLCIFFGPTPASSGKKPAPASPVVIVGETDADYNGLKKIELGEKITVELEKGKE